MTIRTTEQLGYAGETPDSLRDALDAHYARKAEMGATEGGARRWIDRCNELVTELAIAQGYPMPRADGENVTGKENP